MENQTIITPIGEHKIELKPYLTGRDMRELKAIYLRIGKVDATGQGITDIKPEVAEEAENKTFELAIISIDKSPENILKRVLDMPSKDYSFILDEINELTGLSKKK